MAAQDRSCIIEATETRMATDAARTDFDSLYRAHFSDVHRFVFQFVQDLSHAPVEFFDDIAVQAAF